MHTPFLRFGTAFLLFVGLLTARPPEYARAQVAADTLSDQARISLITILPGDAAYSTFGHSALRVYDPAQNLNLSFNYGTFDFSDPLFIPRFAYGRLDYFLSVHSFAQAVRFYTRVEGRPVIEQVLNLNPEQRQAVYRFLQINARPDNRYYRYDFFFDNCSTRIRDVLEQALGEDVQFASTPNLDQSFRRLLDSYVTDKPFLDLGMDLLLGMPAERTATARETHFLPLYLMAAFDHATIDTNGVPHPLVAQTDTVAWIRGYEMSEASWPWPALLFWMLFATGLGLTILNVRGTGKGRRLVDGLLYGVVGLAGLLIAFLWLASEHVVTQDNWNLLWAWPTHLVAAIALVRPRQRQWLRPYLWATATVALITVVGWPFWPQELPSAMLPLALLLAVRSGALAIKPTLYRERSPSKNTKAPSG